MKHKQALLVQIRLTRAFAMMRKNYANSTVRFFCNESNDTFVFCYKCRKMLVENCRLLEMLERELLVSFF